MGMDKLQDELLTAGPCLHLSMNMIKGSLYLQIIHSIAKFFVLEARLELNNQAVDFVVERTSYCSLYPVISILWLRTHGDGKMLLCL